MEKIKTNFIPKGSEEKAISAVQTNRIKMGEVFQLENNQYALVCIRCSEEFEYFTEFVLHAQEHLEKMVSTPPSESLLLSPMSNGTDKNMQMDIKVEDEIKVEPFLMEQNMDERHSVDFEYNFNDNNFTDSDSSDDWETKSSNVARNEKTSDENDKNNKKVKQPAPQSKYEQLLNAFRPTALNESNERAFEALKNEIKSSIIPSDVNDTVAIRMLAMYVQQGYDYEQKDGRLLCPLCDNGNSFKDVDAVRRHILTHSRESAFYCGICCAAFRAPQYLQNHSKNVHAKHMSTFECVYCHQKFKNHRLLMGHMHVHELGEMECVPCNRKFQFASVYRLHMRRVHDVGEDIERKRKEIAKKLCFLCGITCSSAHSLSRHLKLHDENNSWICSVCGKSFKVERNLLRHQRIDHRVSTGK